MALDYSENEVKGWRNIVREYILEAKFFDILILLLVLISVSFVILENIKTFADQYWSFLVAMEWIFTIFFSIEYFLRIICAKRSMKYIFSFFGLIDLIAILPLYISLFIVSGEILQVVRLLRIIRVFSKLIRASYRMDILSKSMLSLNRHIRDKEKLLLSFRPSRKKMLLRYFFIIILMISSLTELVFNSMQQFILFNIQISFTIASLIFIFSIILLIKTEYFIWSERYAITNERIIHSKGIFHEHFQSRTYNYITDLSLNQTILDKILNTGDLVINTAAGEGGELIIKGISHPFKLKRVIELSINSVQGHSSYKNQE